MNDNLNDKRTKRGQPILIGIVLAYMLFSSLISILSSALPQYQSSYVLINLANFSTGALCLLAVIMYLIEDAGK